MIATEPVVLSILYKHLRTTLRSISFTVTTSWWMRWEKCLKLDARSSSMLSSFFTTAFYTFRQLQHSFDAEYWKRTTGWMRDFNMRWISSFLFVFRNVGIALSISRNFSPILGCNPIAKRAALLTGSDWNIDRLFSRLRRSFGI